MAATRYVLLVVSAILAMAIISFWTVSGNDFDIVLFIVLAFLITNALYILILNPNLERATFLRDFQRVLRSPH
jgi:hypothetical protein